MPKFTDDQIAEAKSKYGEVYLLTSETDEGNDTYEFLMKKPGRAALGRFAKKAMTDALKALHNLVFDCLVLPSEDEVRKLFEDKPGMAISVGSELQKIVGTNQDFFVKKL